MSVIKSIVARLSKTAPTTVAATTETEAGYATSEVRFTDLKDWHAACKKLGFTLRKEQTRQIIHHSACNEDGFVVGVFNEDPELVGAGFGRIAGRYFDNRGNIRF